jgi:hypothetical protein
MSERPRSGSAAAIALAVLTVLASCTRGDDRTPVLPDRGVDHRLTGSILVTGGFSPAGFGGLQLVDVATGDERPVRMPTGEEALTGLFLEDGTLVGVLRDGRGRVQAYELDPDQPPRRLGPALPRGSFLEVSAAGDVVLAADCSGGMRGFTLNLARPSAWRPVTAACPAAVSPDGRTIASSPDGRTLVVAPADRRGPPEPLVDLRRLRLPAGVDEDPQIVGRPTWGADGVAVVVAGRSRLAIVIAQPEGGPEVASIGDSSAGFRSALAWEPEGGSLVVANDTHTESVVRTLDPGGGGSVIGLSDEPVAALVWSPAGDAVLASAVFSWIFLDPEGGWLRKVPVNRSRGTPVAWSI